ncbi:phosphocholine cytidylyltransferase family protein [Rhodohalobacter sp. SW132]|uniref:phosphocholine cytidylyltransferase family protein n=1 Tax=Rhodohalobacter sp. SW132 TaxID=2293433 RepID=UPI000E230949|nr:phosphocholine cytidylyltransferase family protein [Rhodohalobacter sp. SW132]REL38632.1 phosphocholine cytidylyltransferase family protein [Rhodohalobacter sp. SW132]
MSSAKAIILAAGQGTRLRPLTDDVPKCMVKVNGKPMLEWQIETLNSYGIVDITVVAGYKEEKIQDPRIKKVINIDFDSTNMVYSLMCAEKEFNREVIVAYGDIIYSKKVLKKVLDSKEDIVLASDELWEQYWNKRCGDPLSDAETFVTGPNNQVKSLGQKANSTKEIDGQFTGLMKFSAKGCDIMKKAYYSCKDDSACIADTWNSGRELKNTYMTDLLNFLSQTSKVTYVSIQRGWFEVDNIKDLKIASEVNFE